MDIDNQRHASVRSGVIGQVQPPFDRQTVAAPGQAAAGQRAPAGGLQVGQGQRRALCQRGTRDLRRNHAPARRGQHGKAGFTVIGGNRLHDRRQAVDPAQVAVGCDPCDLLIETARDRDEQIT